MTSSRSHLPVAEPVPSRTAGGSHGRQWPTVNQADHSPCRPRRAGASYVQVVAHLPCARQAHRIGPAAHVLARKETAVGGFVIKAARDLDLYVVWSTACDGADLIGTRDEIYAYWLAEYGRSSDPAAMLDRVDQAGTSVRARRYGPTLTGAWDDPLPLRVMHPAPGGRLPRAQLAAYAQALQQRRDADAAALLVPHHPVNDPDSCGPRRPRTAPAALTGRPGA